MEEAVLPDVAAVGMEDGRAFPSGTGADLAIGIAVR
jgi:hypothetical protein